VEVNEFLRTTNIAKSQRSYSVDGSNFVETNLSQMNTSGTIQYIKCDHSFNKNTTFGELLPPL
jgi:hypothetical protein